MNNICVEHDSYWQLLLHTFCRSFSGLSPFGCQQIGVKRKEHENESDSCMDAFLWHTSYWLDDLEDFRQHMSKQTLTCFLRKIQIVKTIFLEMMHVNGKFLEPQRNFHGCNSLHGECVRLKLPWCSRWLDTGGCLDTKEGTVRMKNRKEAYCI